MPEQNLISLVEYAKAHGKHPDTAKKKAECGRFKTAQKIGRNWVIDADEPYPEDARVRSGKYKKET